LEKTSQQQRNSVGMLHFCEYVTFLWVCYISVDMLHFCGYVTFLWVCYISVDMLHFCGYVTFLWICYISVDMLHFCGYVTFLWICYISVGMLHFCGYVTILAILFCLGPFVFLLVKIFLIIWLSYILSLSLHDERYFRNMSCGPNLRFFLFNCNTRRCKTTNYLSRQLSEHKKNKPRHMTFENQTLTWDRHKNETG
jgi:hypothetical protein